LIDVRNPPVVKLKSSSTGEYAKLAQEYCPVSEADKLLLRRVLRTRIIFAVPVFVAIGGLAFAANFLFGRVSFDLSNISFEFVIYSLFNLVLIFLAGLMAWGILRARSNINDPWKIVYSGEVKDLWRSAHRVGDRSPGSGSYNLRLDEVRFQIDAEAFAVLKVGDVVRVHCIAPGEVIYISRLNVPERSVVEEIVQKDSKSKFGIVAIILGILEIFHQC
jgi:hypothetical protein